MNVLDYYKACKICPRKCMVNRVQSEPCVCGVSHHIKLALASLHYGEEPPVTGRGGSGTIFFSGCTLGCSNCQNYQLSHELYGDTFSIETFSELCLELQKAGAENINLVTGTQFAPSIVKGLSLAREKGLTIPALWNTSGYDTIETIELLHEEVSVFLPDIKTLDGNLAQNVFFAPDYPDVVKKAITSMVSFGKPQFDERGVIQKGVIVRHLILPNHLENTRTVLDFFSENLDGKAILSLMTQYTPIKNDSKKNNCIDNRLLNEKEYNDVLKLLDEYNIEDGFIQDLVPSTDWLPDFTKYNPFSSELAKTVWHCKS